MTDPSAMNDAYNRQREAMVNQQVVQRGIHSPPVIEALRKVPREAFISDALREFAYDDTPLPIAERQTISQPYIVAYMLDALQLREGGRVLEIGTGSGYAAALLGEMADEVVTLERYKSLADEARDILQRLGYRNVDVIHSDGTLGWPEKAPYDAIVVAAAAPEIPQRLKEQLAIGGRLVIPVGAHDGQSLRCLTRTSEHDYREEHLTSVRFVPLVGEAGWADREDTSASSKPVTAKKIPARKARSGSTSELIAECAEPLDDEGALDALLERIGDSRVVLIGESSHGTSEFYRYRARITQALIEQKGFDLLAVEADWPDASQIDHYVRDLQTEASQWTAFSRFPTWMWRNEEVREFVDWLHDHNSRITDRTQRVGFHGLDLYSLFTSIDSVLDYLEDVDADAARDARERYSCLAPWRTDPSAYGRAAISGSYRECRADVVTALVELLKKRMEYSSMGGTRYLDAMQNARLVANAERYYYSLYGGNAESWNLRDQHMFDTLKVLLTYRGENTKAVVWEHNSHIGDARATDMRGRGQLNLGQLCREAYGNDAYLIGFGTDTGTVAAAADWGEPMEVMDVQPSLEGSWERLCHEARISAFQLPLRHSRSQVLNKRLLEPQLERAIGVIYRPATELSSHYFKARLAQQFDEYIWFDHTTAITPLTSKTLEGTPDTYPFGL
ncbi:protein-L-isoaspartate(D-aspartate) O-methyltransferase [Marinimicrobium sp. ABcell2]|uniref:protein-L-isoaspartate(D-aspartate) O-methyltransferase n=1 Tax=Marinimicrobium sp. ABcell2 TaxID=3069751 RepID=UPI0027B6B9F4|nr:protein-L-isoaspartate(D-aspartate) O-methyltransferase [Marinimicrobium sp. ABcell2]MDQ2078227.1 protein-L-isoaspartate(D-aspartate) O-methyltransferase [Marinimicrobium sp. ABcell2]